MSTINNYFPTKPPNILKNWGFPVKEINRKYRFSVPLPGFVIGIPDRGSGQ